MTKFFLKPTNRSNYKLDNMKRERKLFFTDKKERWAIKCSLVHQLIHLLIVSVDTFACAHCSYKQTELYFLIFV